MPIPLFHVDAFTSQAFRGNPAAVCLLDSWLDDETLQKVAAENHLSATAFLLPLQKTAGVPDYDLRWFTPTCEIRLCGHATLAAAHVLLNRIHGNQADVKFHTRFHGTLSVRRDGESLHMDFPALLPRLCQPRPASLMSVLRANSPPVAVREANETYFVEFAGEEDVRQLSPDFARLEALHPYVVAITAPGRDCDFVSRYFAPSYGVPEDPVTGSAHCALAPYWSERLKKTRLFARQLSTRGGELWCEVAGDRVILQGQAVITLAGSLNL